MTALARGSAIGIIGGGQLGRMMAMAAARLGFRTCVLDPQSDCPASQVSNRHIAAAYDDCLALEELAGWCDVVTYEFENIDLEAARQIEERVPFYPDSMALEMAQDRLTEKTFLNKSNVPTVLFRDVPDSGALEEALRDFDGCGVLKTRRLGYDGKGQIRFRGGNNDPSPQDALASLAHKPAILEEFAPFIAEISVIVTRNVDGTIVTFDPARNVHVDGILATSTVPSGVENAIEAAARRTAAQFARSLSYVGTLGLEYFVMSDGSLLANEFAPRVHNSGHWTEAACTVSQFEQHIRAITGWPLGNGMRHSDCTMENLLGDDIERLAELADEPDVLVHDYGKTESRAGRKMGHFTRLSR